MTPDTPFKYNPTPDDVLARYAEARLNYARSRSAALAREVALFEAVIGAAVAEAGGADFTDSNQQ